jgi:sigma-B regulation protein RsbU (phosphoserine phosphatase)
MSRKHSPGKTRPDRDHGMALTVWGDLRRKDLSRSLGRDLKDLYRFYIDQEKRVRLQKKVRMVLWIRLPFWLLKGLMLKLAPIRRLLVLASLILACVGRVTFSRGGWHFDVNLTLAAFSGLLLVLGLELKDKLLARDELRIGRRVQLALLPKASPSLPGWEIWLYSCPANEVCGDMVDCLAIGEGNLGLTLADVSGKGLGAALLMAKLQATQRALADCVRTLPEMGTRLNHILWRDIPRGSFATFVHLVIAAPNGRVRILNAGHIPPTVIRAGDIEQLAPVAPPLGVIRDLNCLEQETQLEPGDALLVYSDGLTEAADRHGEFYGEERLMALLHALRGLPAEEAGQRVVSEVDNFIGTERPSDDLSMIILRRVG